MTMTDPDGPILAIDVQYVDTQAATTGYAAGVLFNTFADMAPAALYTVRCPDIAPYQPGSFFKRELPPLLDVIAACPRPPKIVVVDGFVDLAPGKRGLGRYLYEHLGSETIVIGVAKNPFLSGRREAKAAAAASAANATAPSGADADHTPEGDTPTPPAVASDPGTPAPAELGPGAILRGASKKALYVTCAGIEQAEAERLIVSMHGKHRIPTLLKLVDNECRQGAKKGEAEQGAGPP